MAFGLCGFESRPRHPRSLLGASMTARMHGAHNALQESVRNATESGAVVQKPFWTARKCAASSDLLYAAPKVTQLWD